MSSSARPTHRCLCDAEASLRELEVFVSVLVSRLTLARAVSGAGEFADIADADLRNVEATAIQARQTIDAVLGRIEPAYAARTAAVAAATREGELTATAQAARPRLALVEESDRDA